MSVLEIDGDWLGHRLSVVTNVRREITSQSVEEPLGSFAGFATHFILIDAGRAPLVEEDLARVGDD
jgi:hypothetical protein